MNNKVDSHGLKSKHRIERVMVDAGEKLVDGDSKDQLKSLTTPGLFVDTHRQTFTLSVVGRDPERGDVIAWLRRHYRWTFLQAVHYLQTRKPDPVVEAEEQAQEKPAKIKIVEDSLPDPEQLDRWQRKAMKLFGKKASENAYLLRRDNGELLNYLNLSPHRFLEVIDVDADECYYCGKKFDWEMDDTRAYVEQHLADDEIDEEEKEICWFGNDRFFEFLICKDCMNQHKRDYLAIRYLYISVIHNRRERLQEEFKREIEESNAREEERIREEDLYWAKEYEREMANSSV